MNKNLFASAKFGDKFKTRDGRMAIYIGRDHVDDLFPMVLWVELENKYFKFQEDGSVSLSLPDRPIDIVSRWEEPIDEDNLRSILPSRNEIQDYLDDNGYLDEDGNFIDYVERAVQIGFELGYKTAKQE